MGHLNVHIFSFHKCLIYTHDDAFAKVSTSWGEMDYSVKVPLTVSLTTKGSPLHRQQLGRRYFKQERPMTLLTNFSMHGVSEACNKFVKPPVVCL
jgi:hypothetical protein